MMMINQTQSIIINANLDLKKTALAVAVLAQGTVWSC